MKNKKRDKANIAKDTPSKEQSEEVVKDNSSEANASVVEENAELKKANEEILNLKDRLLRNVAELENFKRRSNEERIQDRKYRAQSLITDIVPVLDNFERALTVKSEIKEVETFVSGMKMVYNMLLEALKSEGLEILEPKVDDKFNPNLHQALMVEKVEGKDSELILEVLQKGYLLKDRVVKPAMVKVSE